MGALQRCKYGKSCDGLGKDVDRDKLLIKSSGKIYRRYPPMSTTRSCMMALEFNYSVLLRLYWMMISVNLMSVIRPSGSTNPPPKASVFAIKSSLCFPSSLQRWMPPSIVVGVNNILATGEFIIGAVS